MSTEDLNNIVIHCKGLLFDEQGRLLLVRQAESIGTYWNAPGGRMEDDDSPESCMRREVQEETGLVVESTTLVYSHSIAVPGVTDFYFGFHVTEYSGELGVGIKHTAQEEQEILEIRFVDRMKNLQTRSFRRSCGMWPLPAWTEASRQCSTWAPRHWRTTEIRIQSVGSAAP